MPTRKNDDHDHVEIVYWAQVWHRDPSVHGECENSPAFGSELELAQWVRQHRHDGDIIHPYRRTQSGGGFRNESLRAPEPPFANLDGEIAKLAATLSGKSGRRWNPATKDWRP